jgi:uncharacterized protein YciI
MDGSSLPPARYTVLHYDYVDGMLERREPVRADHLSHVQAAKHRGELVNAGAFDNGEGAMLVFGPDMDEPARRFVADDPYAKAGLIVTWRVGTWNVVA